MEDNGCIEMKCEKFMNILNRKFHSCFEKTRIKNSSSSWSKNEDIHKYLIEKSRLSQSLAATTCSLAKEIIEGCIENLEGVISQLSSRQNAALILENLDQLRDSQGNFSQVSMWRLKNKILPQKAEPPMAKRDQNDMLITSPQLIKELYLSTYRERLHNREIKSRLEDLYHMKTQLWEVLLEDSENTVTDDWTEAEIDKVIKG